MSILPLLTSASLMLPATFVPPKGWTPKAPPAGASVDFMWLSPHFGLGGNGENLTVMSFPVSTGATLDAQVHNAIGELSQERIVKSSHAEPTCRGSLSGWAFEALLPQPNGSLVSQIYHLTIVDGRAYTFVFTHAPGDRVDPAIGDSIQSICPSNGLTI